MIFARTVNRLRVSGSVRHNINMGSELIIFDCDGVLIDSELIACRSSATCLAEVGIPITVDEIAERYVGISTTAMFANLEAKSGRFLPPGFAEKVRLQLMSRFDSELIAMPGVALPLGVRI